MSLLDLLDEEELERPRETPEVTAKAAWGVALRRAASKFSSDQCTDKAAALTYYSVQSLVPGLIAVLSLINVFGNGKNTTQHLLKIIAGVVGKDPNDKSLDFIRHFVDQLHTVGGGGFALVIGVLLAIWSASGYVSGFSRALNKIYEVPEGRPVWKLRPALYLVTIIEMVLIIVVMIALTTTGGVARSIAKEIGIAPKAVQVWDLAKWPFVVLIVVFIIGMLYWATPNVRKTKRDIFTWGALIGFVVWVVASLALLTYLTLTNGASYAKTYGILAGVIVFLLWLWITNIAMLFGAEVDAELIRTRQLKSGFPAEELILLPPKDDSMFAKKDLKAAKEYDVAHTLRLDAMREAAGDPHVYGRAALTAGHAAQVVGDASTATRSGKTGLVGPRDASAERPDPHAGSNSDATSGENAVAYDLEAEAAAIEEDRLHRRDNFLREAGKARVIRDRLDRQRAKAEAKRKLKEAEQERQRKIEESYITRQQRWESVAKVRAEFDPPETAERDQVNAERRARRAAYDLEQAEKAAKGPQKPAPRPRHHGAGVSAPSALRAEVEREQQGRHDEWFASHPPRVAK